MAVYAANATVAAIWVSEPAGTLTPAAMSPMPWLPNQVSQVGTVLLEVNIPAVTVETYPAAEQHQESGTFDFFEDFHVIPRAFDFGNLLSDVSEAIEVFSAFRHQTREWTDWINNAGAGVSLGGDPPLPHQMEPLTGLQMTLDVSAIGPPFVDTTLDFVFDIGTAYVPIQIQRIVLWGLEPELPFVERLGFLTDVLKKRSGKEQRLSLRKNPRIAYQYKYLLEEGETRQRLENLLFEWQSRIFGVPVWFDDTQLTVAAVAGNATITVQSTSFRDFRVGGLAAVFTSQTTFDVLTILSKTTTTITFSTPLLGNYPVGTYVYPLLPCYAERNIQGARWPNGLASMDIEFKPTDNDVDLASTAAFGTYNSKVLLDRFISVLGGTSPESFSVELIEVDNETGIPELDSLWDRHKRGSLLAVRASGRQEVWELRGLVRALRGRQISFYVPRQRDDLEITANLLNASTAVEIANWGYAQFVRNRQPKNVIRVSFVDNSTPLVRTILNSTTLDATTDELEVDVPWPATINVSNIARCEYVEKVRLDTDEVELQYDRSGHRAHLVAPVMAVFE